MIRSKVFQGAVLLGISSFLSRLLGVYRDHLFAIRFGATQGSGIYDLDAYFAAFRIPDFLYNLLIIGAVSSAFVPIFTGYIQKEQKEEGFAFANTVLNFFVSLMLILSVILFIAAPFVMKILTPGFSPEKLAVSVNATRIMLLSPIFFAFSSIAQSIQNTFKTFFSYALAPILYNLSIIFAALFLTDRFGIYGLGFGVTVGAFFHFFIQVPSLYSLGYRYRFLFNLKRKDLREMFRLVVPRIIGVSAMQLIFVFDTLIGSTLAAGSISIFYLAFNLNSLPMGIVGISLAISSFSTLSELADKGREPFFADELKRYIRWILFLIIPATFGILFLRREVTQLILGGGKFTLRDVFLTSQTLFILGLSLVAQSLIPLFSRAFYAWKNTVIPLVIVMVTVFSHISLSLFFTKVLFFGVKGIAFAYSISQILQIALLFLFLKRFLPSFSIFPLKDGMKFLFSSFLMILFVFIGRNFLVPLFPLSHNFYALFFELIFLIFLGFFGYALGIFFTYRKRLNSLFQFTKKQ
ncbi:murein biosynthesis integral membrane protein MurJ [Candidatus Peregrinibacteria bacterium]|nr:murein biosynthesis integral membrane protein MurJ [Candidatus Peregrinibacteria bacterium]